MSEISINFSPNKISSNIKSPLRYPGGKSRAVGFLSQFIPKDFSEYREIFFGGGSFGIFLRQFIKNADSNLFTQNLLKNDIKFIANDLNYDLFCFWQSLKNNPNELVEGIYKLKNEFSKGRDLYEFLLQRRNIIESKRGILQRGIDFFILNRITFSGLLDCGGYSQKAFEGRLTKSSIDTCHTKNGWAKV